MIIPENENILFKAYNEIKKSKFYMQAAIISLIPCSFIASLYFLFKAFNVYAYFAFVLVFYLLLVLITASKLYKDYTRFYGSDEMAISNTKIYFNVCMNKGGNNVNVDSNRYLSEIKNAYIVSLWNPKRLKIEFNDDTYIVIHCVKDIEDVLNYINDVCKLA